MRWTVRKRSIPRGVIAAQPKRQTVATFAKIQRATLDATSTFYEIGKNFAEPLVSSLCLSTLLAFIPDLAVRSNGDKRIKDANHDGGQTQRSINALLKASLSRSVPDEARSLSTAAATGAKSVKGLFIFLGRFNRE